MILHADFEELRSCEERTMHHAPTSCAVELYPSVSKARKYRAGVLPLWGARLDMPPGEYRCEGVTVYDVHLNRKTFHPDIRFRVVNIPGDHEGPELFGWRVSKE
jgi:hypothetical protein